MTLRSRIMMSDTGTSWNFEGPPVEASGYYGVTSGDHSIAMSVHSFVGRIYLYGTLENSPEEADDNDGWVLIKPKGTDIQQSIINIVSDGVLRQYTINVPGSSANMFLTVNGILQTPGIDYTYVNGLLDFSTVPSEGDKISIRIMSPNFNPDQFGEPYFQSFNGDGVSKTFTVQSGSIGSTHDCFVSIDGSIKVPFNDFVYNNQELVFVEAPALDSLINFTCYPPKNQKLQTDYFYQFPNKPSDIDEGNILITPMYGPRTTSTVLQTFTGNFTYVKAVLNRDYLEPYYPDMPLYKLQAVGAVSQILLNF